MQIFLFLCGFCVKTLVKETTVTFAKDQGEDGSDGKKRKFLWRFELEMQFFFFNPNLFYYGFVFMCVLPHMEPLKSIDQINSSGKKGKGNFTSTSQTILFVNNKISLQNFCTVTYLHVLIVIFQWKCCRRVKYVKAKFTLSVFWIFPKK